MGYKSDLYLENRAHLKIALKRDFGEVLNAAMREAGYKQGLSGFLKQTTHDRTHIRYVHPESKAVVVDISEHDEVPAKTRTVKKPYARGKGYYEVQEKYGAVPAHSEAIVFSPDHTVASKITLTPVHLESTDQFPAEKILAVTQIEDYGRRVIKEKIGKKNVTREFSDAREERTRHRRAARFEKLLWGHGPFHELNGAHETNGEEGPSLSRRFRLVVKQGALRRERTFREPQVSKYYHQSVSGFMARSRIGKDRVNYPDGSFDVTQHNGRSYTLTEYNHWGTPRSRTTYNQYGEAVKKGDVSKAVRDIPRRKGWHPHKSGILSAEAQNMRYQFRIISAGFDPSEAMDEEIMAQIAEERLDVIYVDDEPVYEAFAAEALPEYLAELSAALDAELQKATNGSPSLVHS